MNVPFVYLLRSVLINRLFNVLFLGASTLRFERAGGPWLNFSLVFCLFLIVTATSGTLRHCSFPNLTKNCPRAVFEIFFAIFPQKTGWLISVTVMGFLRKQVSG